MNEEQKQDGISNLATALCKAQAIMTGAKKDKANPFFKSNYADLASVIDAIREPFAANGLSYSQPIDVLENGKSILITKLMHTSGQVIEGRMLLPEESNPQKMGSILTYYRRYCLMAIAGIPAEDDDGNAASGKARPNLITPKQVADLDAMINGHDHIRKELLSKCNNDLSSIRVEQYPSAVSFVKDLVEKANV